MKEDLDGTLKLLDVAKPVHSDSTALHKAGGINYFDSPNMSRLGMILYVRGERVPLTKDRQAFMLLLTDRLFQWATRWPECRFRY